MDITLNLRASVCLHLEEELLQTVNYTSTLFDNQPKHLPLTFSAPQC